MHTPSSDKAEQALSYFYRGYSCAQSVLAPFADELGLSEAQALRLAAPFGAGIGRMRLTCGAFSALCMVAGHLHGNEEGTAEGKARIYALTQELAARFRAEMGSLSCRELLGLDEHTPEPVTPEARTPEYYKGRPCMRCISFAAAQAAALMAKS